jgi:hypothetical protein
MKESFTPDEELVMLFLKKHAKSTAVEIAMHTGLRQRAVLRDAHSMALMPKACFGTLTTG